MPEKKQREIKYIAVEGVIGAGKTSLAKKLSERLNAQLVLEKFEENPFLEKFYQDRKRYAFQTQMFFLINRYKQQQELMHGNLFADYLVADYIFEKDKVFAYLNLDKDELQLYESIFPLLQKTLIKPDLVLFLHSHVDRLMYNIKKRNRNIEKGIAKNYIQELSESYTNFFFSYSGSPLLIVDSSEIDFVSNKKDFEELFAAIFRADRAPVEYFQPETRKLF